MRAVAPVLEEIAGERSDVKIVKLNTDENQQAAAQFGVISIPTMILFKNGAEAHRVVGAYPKAKLLSESSRSSASLGERHLAPRARRPQAAGAVARSCGTIRRRSSSSAAVRDHGATARVARSCSAGSGRASIAARIAAATARGSSASASSTTWSAQS